MVRPQTKARNVVVLSSDDEFDTIGATSTPPKKGDSKRMPNRSSKPPANGSLQKSPRNRGKLRETTGMPTKGIESFFSAMTHRQEKRTEEPATMASSDHLEDVDNIEDDFSNEQENNNVTRQGTIPPTQDTRKRSWSVANSLSTSKNPRSTKQRFLSGPENTNTASSIQPAPGGTSQSPWNDIYAPQGIDELAVHPRKLADVRKWLEGVFEGRIYQRLLILKGAAGTGKTTSVRLLVQELGCSLAEWKSPSTLEYASSDYVSNSTHFGDFLSRVGKYNGLAFVDIDKRQDGSSVTPTHTRDETAPRQAVLVEEFPSLVGSSTTALNAFRSQVLQYMLSNIPSRGAPVSASPVPLIIVISESVLSQSESSDNFTAHRLLGRDILHHPGTTVIEFNNVAPTYLSKALNLVLRKHRHATTRGSNPGPGIVQKLSEVGDVRNAVSTLEYLCSNLEISSNAQVLAKVPKAKSKTRTTGSRSKKTHEPPDPDDAAALSLIQFRESTIGLFHAVGKVVYNKRGNNEDGGERQTRPEPDLDIDLLLDSTGTDAPTFMSALHENYALSCCDPYGDDEATLDSINGSLDALGDADMLMSNSGGQKGRSGWQRGPSTGEGLRQDELAFHVGVRGLQYALPWPVRRQNTNRGGNSNPRHGSSGSEAHRMFYPTDIKLWRKRVEYQGLLDHIVDEASKGTLLLGLATRRLDSSPSASTSQPGRLLSPRPLKTTVPAPSADEGSAGLRISSGQSARKLMLLERLPYISRIFNCCADGKASASATSRLREIERLTRFSGVGVAHDEESDEEDGMVRTRDGHARKGQGLEVLLDTSTVDGEAEGEKLVLSEDDIVDD